MPTKLLSLSDDRVNLDPGRSLFVDPYQRTVRLGIDKVRVIRGLNVGKQVQMTAHPPSMRAKSPSSISDPNECQPW